MKRPSRAGMCNWLSTAIANALTLPTNPANTRGIFDEAHAAKKRLSALALIADELGNHVDASLDRAWAMCQEYEALQLRTDSQHG